MAMIFLYILTYFIFSHRDQLHIWSGEWEAEAGPALQGALQWPLLWSVHCKYNPQGTELMGVCDYKAYTAGKGDWFISVSATST